MYKMINREEHNRRLLIQNVIGNAVKEGNQDYTVIELGQKAIEALEAEGYEIIWLKGCTEDV